MGNNHTSKINVFPVLHTIFFLLAGQKVDFFAPHGAIKFTLWPASRKKNIIFFMKKNVKLTNNYTFNNFFCNVYFSGKIFSTNLLFPILKVKFSVAEIVKSIFEDFYILTI